jgi:presenilin-like A22 family membrane protease
VPIPDMPIYFGFIIAIITAIFIINKNDKKWILQK